MPQHDGEQWEDLLPSLTPPPDASLLKLEHWCSLSSERCCVPPEDIQLPLYMNVTCCELELFGLFEVG